MTWPERRRRWVTRAALVLGCIAALTAVLCFLPIPYIIFGPGAAVDLSRAINVPGHTPPPGHFYLTDVDVLPGRPIFYIAAKLLPGFEIIRRSDLVPPTVSDRDLDRQLFDAMRESQMNAQIVAERAAGLPVKARSYFVVIKTVPGSPGSRCFRPGDRISKIGGKAVQDPDALARATTSRPPGTAFALVLTRSGKQQATSCPTFSYRGKARFGMTGQFLTEAYRLPVHVTYTLPNINGSSAGLMFALQIYRTLTGHDIGAGKDIAGTGVLGTDGTVLPIEGAREKIRAAIKSGAVVFLVPVQNYDEIRNTPGIRVVAVKSFADALRALLGNARAAASHGSGQLTRRRPVSIMDKAYSGRA
ncbi:MAG TPA: S16 family serine protease [Candidatus Eremiobacteraceae bacterium]|nr:S16 family serine protease [Candidatus Eremiobacteraceae bacterium]